MPIQIDRMDTSVEITTPAAPTGSTSGERRATTAADPQAQSAMRELVGQVMADELDRFMRNRGM
jgi:hypothetical protein